MNMPSLLAKHWTFDPTRVFLNHGSFGACPDFVINEQRMWQELMEKEPVQFFEELMPDLLHKSRTEFGEFSPVMRTIWLCIQCNLWREHNSAFLVLEQGDEILVPNHAYQACRNTIDFVASRWGAKVSKWPFHSQSMALKS